MGDDETKLAVPLEVVPGGDDLVNRLLKISEDDGVDAFVIGVPMPVGDRAPSKQQKRTEHFIDTLKKCTEKSVFTVDEQYTSAESKRIQNDMGSNVEEDALAAMLILQQYFDQMVT